MEQNFGGISGVEIWYWNIFSQLFTIAKNKDV